MCRHVAPWETANPPALPWPLTDAHLCHSHPQHAASDTVYDPSMNITLQFEAPQRRVQSLNRALHR